MSSTEALRAYEISTDPARLDIAAMHAYLARSYWSPGIPYSTVEHAARHSLCFGLYEKAGGRQVGLARVVTDHATFAYLCDVYVLEEHRGHGLGKLLMRAVMAHPQLQGLRRFTLNTIDAHGLCASFGFAPPRKPETAMEIYRPGLYEQPSPHPEWAS